MEKNSEDLASRLSYEIVKEVAPDELDLFDDIKEEFLKNRGKRKSSLTEFIYTTTANVITIISRTKFESSQKDAPEFIPSVVWLGLNRYWLKNRM